MAVSNDSSTFLEVLIFELAALYLADLGYEKQQSCLGYSLIVGVHFLQIIWNSSPGLPLHTPQNSGKGRPGKSYSVE